MWEQLFIGIITAFLGILSYVIHAKNSKHDRELKNFRASQNVLESRINKIEEEKLKEQKLKEDQEDGVIIQYKISGWDRAHKILTNNPHALLRKMEEIGF